MLSVKMHTSSDGMTSAPRQHISDEGAYRTEHLVQGHGRVCNAYHAHGRGTLHAWGADCEVTMCRADRSQLLRGQEMQQGPQFQVQADRDGSFRPNACLEACHEKPACGQILKLYSLQP